MVEIRNDDVESLKAEINERLNDLDEEDIEKIKKIRETLEKRSTYRSDNEIKRLNRINTSLSFYQRFKHSLESNVDIDPGRMQGLTDGIFGMVMTLLVFGMALPEAKLLTNGDFLIFLQSIAPTFGITIVSFILVSSFWVYNHEFIKINNLNIPFLWLNIFHLACISFIPFSTSIIGVYSEFYTSEVIFGVIIFLTIFTFLLTFRYASNKGFLDHKPDNHEKRYIYHTFFIIMGLTIIVNILDFRVSNKFIYLFLLVPVISTLRDISYKMKI